MKTCGKIIKDSIWLRLHKGIEHTKLEFLGARHYIQTSSKLWLHFRQLIKLNRGSAI